MALVVPLSNVPSQNLSITLNGQNCTIQVKQRSTGIYFYLSFNGTPVCINSRCLNLSRLLLDRGYFGFSGDFMFIDTQGFEDPDYTGLGARFILVYLEATDLVGV